VEFLTDGVLMLLRLIGWTFVVIALLALGPVLRLTFWPAHNRDWRTASHLPVGIAPKPAEHHDAVVQVYAARAFGWRGAVAVHCWLAVKPAGAAQYSRYEVIGWNLYGRRSVVTHTETRTPDSRWYGAMPVLLRDLRGAAAERVIAAVPDAVSSYPYPWSYRAWPGPNSNSFIAHIGRAIPELRLALPAIALGKDYLTTQDLIARAPSGTGYQISLRGVLGVMIAWEEGIEFNLLGLVAGIRARPPAVVVPGFGELPSRTPGIQQPPAEPRAPGASDV
jgi:hypothetical protein